MILSQSCFLLSTVVQCIYGNFLKHYLFFGEADNTLDHCTNPIKYVVDSCLTHIRRRRHNLVLLIYMCFLEISQEKDTLNRYLWQNVNIMAVFL